MLNLAFGEIKTRTSCCVSLLLKRRYHQRSITSWPRILALISYHGDSRPHIQPSSKGSLNTRLFSSFNCNSSLSSLSSTTVTVFSKRRFSNDSSSSSGSNPPPVPPEKMPPLMVFPHIMWPKFTYAIKNFFLTYIVIKPHMDREFDMKEFDQGARQALSLISNCMANGKLDDLVGLVTPDALSEIKENIQKLSIAQKDMLAVEVEDIYFSFPYQVGIIMPNDESERTLQMQKNWVEAKRVAEESNKIPPERPPQTRYVEITVGFHVLRGLAEKLKAEGGRTKHFLEFLRQEDTKYKVMVCNYRFWRDFTEGVSDSSWIVNMVSHFMPAAEQYK